MIAGALEVQLFADIARIKSDMDKAQSIVGGAMSNIDKSLGVVKNSLKALGAGFLVGLTFDKLKDKITGTIEAAAGLQHLAERTGSLASELSGLAAVAKLSGTDTDALATGLQKLSKATVDAKDGGAKSAAAFAAIGISVDDLKGKRPAEIFELIAKKQALYADGAEKTAVMQALLGKAGANLLPVMKDIAEVGDLQIKTTDEQAAAALEYEKNLRRLEAAQTALFKIVGMEMLPVLNAFAKAMLESATRTDGVRGAVQDLAKDGSIRDWAENTATVVGFVVDAFDGVARTVQIVGKTIGAAAAQASLIAQGEFRAAMNVGKDWQNEIDAIAQKQLFSDRLAKQLAAARGGGFVGPPAPDRPAPKFRPISAETAAIDAGKQILDEYLKFYDGFLADEKKQLQDREQMIDFYNRLEYTNLREAVEKKEALLKDNLATSLAVYDAEQTLIQQRLANKALDPKERAKDEARLQEVIRARANAEIEANKAITDGQLKLLEVQRQFDLQTKERARQDAISNESAQFAIDLMGKSTLEVLKATEARRIQLELEERIYQIKKKDPSADTSAAVAQAAIQTAQATALIEASYNKQRDAIYGAHEALRKYIEESGNSGAHVEQVMTDGLRGLEDAFVNLFTKGKFGWRDLENTIITGITRIIVQEQLMKPIASYLQGSGGAGGGVFGSFFSTLLGGGGGSSGGGFGTGSTFGNLDFAGFFADGGFIPPGGWGVAGENGAERVYGGKSGVTVMPNGNGDRPQNITINQTFAPGTSTTTINQAAARAADALRRAGRNR